jgi:hypothetical protein
MERDSGTHGHERRINQTLIEPNMTIQIVATYFIGAATASIVAVIVNQRLVDALKNKKAELRHMVRQAHEQDIKVHEAVTQLALMKDRYITLSSDYDTVHNNRKHDAQALAILQEDFERLKFEFKEADDFRTKVRLAKKKYMERKRNAQ